MEPFDVKIFGHFWGTSAINFIIRHGTNFRLALQLTSKPAPLARLRRGRSRGGCFRYIRRRRQEGRRAPECLSPAITGLVVFSAPSIIHENAMSRVSGAISSPLLLDKPAVLCPLSLPVPIPLGIYSDTFSFSNLRSYLQFGEVIAWRRNFQKDSVSLTISGQEIRLLGSWGP